MILSRLFFISLDFDIVLNIVARCDDIVGTCEHYLTALEIMKEMTANDKGLKAKGEKIFCLSPFVFSLFLIFVKK